MLSACLACALVLGGVAAAQAPLRQVVPSKENAARLRWLQYRMVAGRVAADSNYPPGMNISFGPSANGRRREHLRLLILKTRASIHYDLSGEGDKLSIALDESGEFAVRRVSAEPAYEMEFVQQPGGALLFTIVEGERQRSLRSRSFWHLYLAEPKTVERHLVPYLELLRPGWQLAATGRAIEDAMVQRAQHPEPLDTEHWQQLVDQLGSAKFSERETAEHDLLELGQVILPFLEGLRSDQLDAEQSDRVAALVDRLSAQYEDTTDRVATWLAADRDAWLALLDRDEPIKRRIAVRRLERLTGSEIDFDPDADAQAREAQLEKLRARYAEPEPAAPKSPAAPKDSVPPPRADR
ncbi:MAG: hypothetical protein DWQ37_12545 [Planctomycetota bacterium]|nr:MAG: hypothetical protein DWQ37_12545 [Planctomycetota bacterium]